MEALHTLTADAKAELYARRGYLQEDDEKVRKAVALVEEGRIEPGDRTKDQYEVVGNSGEIYTTSPKLCSCKARRSPDTPYACYHMLGIALYRWVAETMQKQGALMFMDETLADIDPETAQNGQEHGEHIGMSKDAPMQTNVDPGANEGQKTASPDMQPDLQRHEIRRLLTLYGLKLKTKEEYAAAVDTHIGLPLMPEHFGTIITRLEQLIAARQQALPSPKLLSDYMVDIMGKKHIQYGGLLAYAHEQGLISIDAHLTTATKELAIATATATFKDGRIFTETADATPENVKAHIKPHFMRMAVTRAKARALRDALNIGEAAAEELDA